MLRSAGGGNAAVAETEEDGPAASVATTASIATTASTSMSTGSAEGATGVDTATRVQQAKMQGYEGENCSECGNFTLVRNGTCLKCNTCGSTTGCS